MSSIPSLLITDPGNKDSTPPPTSLSLANEVIDLAPSADDPVSGGTPASGGIDPVSGGTSANKYNSILHPDPGYKPCINSGDLFDIYRIKSVLSVFTITSLMSLVTV